MGCYASTAREKFSTLTKRKSKKYLEDTCPSCGKNGRDPIEEPEEPEEKEEENHATN